MFNQPRQTLEKIKKLLISQQQEVQEELKSIEEDDPVHVEALPEAPEAGTESWQAEVHGRLGSLKADLVNLSDKIRTSLLKLNKGTYGKCERCGKPIEAKRLEAIPTATLCMSCSKRDFKR